MIAPILFTWVQGADFYKELHRDAVNRVPFREGMKWTDVGCGPGLVSRLAAARGYKVTGIDMNPLMIKAAVYLARHQKSSAKFNVGSVFALPVNTADVVSAASLLAVLDDKKKGLQALWNCVKPEGHLLLIEPTGRMNPDNASRVIANSYSQSKRIQGLRLWAKARKNRTVNPDIIKGIQSESLQYFELLEGLVGVWLLTKHKP